MSNIPTSSERMLRAKRRRLLPAVIACVCLAHAATTYAQGTPAPSPTRTPPPAAASPGRSPTPKPAPDRSSEILLALFEIGARVDANMTDLIRRTEEAGKIADHGDRQKAFIEIAGDAKQQILDKARRPAPSPAEPPAAAPPTSGLGGAPAIAIAVSILALCVAVATFFMVRTSTRRALRDAGLL